MSFDLFGGGEDRDDQEADEDAEGGVPPLEEWTVGDLEAALAEKEREIEDARGDISDLVGEREHLADVLADRRREDRFQFDLPLKITDSDERQDACHRLLAELEDRGSLTDDDIVTHLRATLDYQGPGSAIGRPRALSWFGRGVASHPDAHLNGWDVDEGHPEADTVQTIIDAIPVEYHVTVAETVRGDEAAVEVAEALPSRVPGGDSVAQDFQLSVWRGYEAIADSAVPLPTVTLRAEIHANGMPERRWTAVLDALRELPTVSPPDLDAARLEWVGTPEEADQSAGEAAADG